MLVSCLLKSGNCHTNKREWKDCHQSSQTKRSGTVDQKHEEEEAKAEREKKEKEQKEKDK